MRGKALLIGWQKRMEGGRERGREMWLGLGKFFTTFMGVRALIGVGSLRKRVFFVECLRKMGNSFHYYQRTIERYSIDPQATKPTT
jgi:hypothetical protein